MEDTSRMCLEARLCKTIQTIHIFRNSRPGIASGEKLGFPIAVVVTIPRRFT